MYGEKVQQEKAYDMPTAIHQPELQRIVEKLQDAINLNDNIVLETRGRLQNITRFEEPKNDTDAAKEPPRESVLDEVNYLINRLKNLNNIAESNLRHLKEIV